MEVIPIPSQHGESDAQKVLRDKVDLRIGRDFTEGDSKIS